MQNNIKDYRFLSKLISTYLYSHILGHMPTSTDVNAEMKKINFTNKNRVHVL